MPILNKNWYERWKGVVVGGVECTLNPTIAWFGRKELEALDEAFLSDFAEEHPRLADTITIVSGILADPIWGNTQLKEIMRALKFKISSSRNHFGQAISELPLEAQSIVRDSPAVTETRAHLDREQSYCNTVEGQLPYYLTFIEDLTKTIVQQAGGGLASTHALAIPERRNKIYRAALPEAHPWVLGLGCIVYTHAIKLAQLDFELRQRHYARVKDAHIEMPVVHRVDVPGTAPPPPGTLQLSFGHELGRRVADTTVTMSDPMDDMVTGLKMTVQEMYEGAYAARQPHSTELQKLADGLEAYFNSRTQEILAS
jgi:hypothetical protein